MRILKVVLVVVAMSIALVCNGRGNGKDLSSRVMAPLLEEDVTPASVPEWLPAYKVGRDHQVLIGNGWTGRSDCSASLSVAWTPQTIIMVIDVTDDKLITSTSIDPGRMTGDHVLLKFHSGTAKHNLSAESFDLLLTPDFKTNNCRARLLASETAAKLIGKPSCDMAVKPDKTGYRLVMRIPFRLWTVKPAVNKELTFQAFFGDSDEGGKVDHTLIFFERWPAASTAAAAKGTIQFVDNAWARLQPKSAKQDDGNLSMLVDWGNRTDKPLSLSVSIKDRLGTVVKTFTNVLIMGAGKNAVKARVSLKLPKMQGGKEFDVIPTIGAVAAPVAFTFLSNPDGETSLFCLRWVDRQSRLRRRKLAVTQRPDLVEQTFRVLAGGGTLLWHAGVYDNSSREFEEMMHPNGKFVISVTPGRSPSSEQVPWAIFGGGDALDGMNEPVVLDLSAVAPGRPLQREIPAGFVYLHEKKEYAAKALASSKVLLLGLTCLKSDGDHYPHIRVTNQAGQVLLSEKLRPGRSQFPEQPHAFVLRVWLRNSDKEVRISNISKTGSKVEVDFMALVGGGDALKQSDDGPRIEFEGSTAATYLNRMLAANLFLSRNYMFAKNGSTFASPPGGSEFLFNLFDHYALLEELSAWGFLKETRGPILNLGSAPSYQHKQFTTEDSAMGMIRVMAAWNLWRKTGCDQRVISALWLPVIKNEISKITELSMTNKMGLMTGSGEFGVPDESRGVTVPLQDLSVAALACGVDMAKAMGQDRLVGEWSAAHKRIIANMQTHLVAPPGGEKMTFSQTFPAANGLPTQKGINATVAAGAYVYARDANRKVIPYNGSVRVYDTPYHFAGLPYLATGGSMVLEPVKANTVRQTLTYVRSGPALNNKPFLQRQISTFNSSSTHMWTALALLMTENVNFGGKVVEALIHYSYDGFAGIDKRADMEISPYGIEEGLSVGEDFNNLGGVKDECRARSLAYFLKIARLMGGVDDHDMEVLHLNPRLLAGWKAIKVSDWIVSHSVDANHKTATVDMVYERVDGGFKLAITSDRELKKVKVRFGPFHSRDRVVALLVEGERPERVKTKVFSGKRWAEVTLNQVRKTAVEVKSALF